MTTKTIYGLKKDEYIEDPAWFWQEVKLRAMNNYDNWADRDEAFMKVEKAIKEICKDAGISIEARKWIIDNKMTDIVEIVDDMMDGR